LSSEDCLWSYLEGIAEKRLSPSTKFSKIYSILLNLLMVTLPLFSAIFGIMNLFPKLTETIPTILIKKFIIIALMLEFIFVYIIMSIEFELHHIIQIFGLRGLVRILPALINELKGKLPKDVEEDAQKYIKKYPCMERFRGNAAKVLSRISRDVFFLMWSILSLLSLFNIIFIGSILTIPTILHYCLNYCLTPITPYNYLYYYYPYHLLRLKILSILRAVIESAVTKTVVEIVLWVLGVVLSIVIGLFLFSSQARFDKNTLRFVYDVKFTVLGRFVVAVFLIIISLIIISVKMPPIIVIVITVPALIALIISITVYVILASAVLDYIQLPRNNQGEN